MIPTEAVAAPSERRLRALPEGPVEWTCKLASEAALVVMLVLVAVDIVTRWVFNFSFEVSFAMDVGGPLRGWTDREWEEPISGLLVQGKYQALARRATEERINRAGNNSGELLNWITLTGALGKTRPLFLENDDGSGYAVWKLE